MISTRSTRQTHGHDRLILAVPFGLLRVAAPIGLVVVIAAVRRNGVVELHTRDGVALLEVDGEHFLDVDVLHVVVVVVHEEVVELRELLGVVQFFLEVKKTYLDCIRIEKNALEREDFIAVVGLEELPDVEYEAEPFLGQC